MKTITLAEAVNSKWSRSSETKKLVFSDKIGQTIVEKLSKLSKKGSSVKLELFYPII